MKSVHRRLSGKICCAGSSSRDTKWYVAGINAQKETLKLKVKLPMVQDGAEVKLFSDDDQLNGKV